MTRRKRLPATSLQLAALALATLLCTLSACSRDKPPEPLATPTIDDVLPPSFREIWEPWTGDLDGMIERRVVRVVTPFGGYMYYYEDGEPRGATWELANRLETYLNEQLGRRHIRVFVMVIPLSRDQMIPALLDGHADIIAADLTMTEMRSQQLAFTRPLLKDINEVIVTSGAADNIETLADLGNKPIHVRRSSSYYEHLKMLSESLQAEGLPAPDIVAVDELLESEDILDMLNAGMIDVTVLDDYKAQFWAQAFPNIEVRDDLVVNEGGAIAWVTRQESPELLTTLNQFLRKFGRGTMIGNDTYNRYLDDARELRCSETFSGNARLESMTKVFRRYAEQYGFDWLQLAAQGYQESKLRQNRKSNAGAVGVMQIKPSTAADPNIGIDDVTTVDGNVHAGSKYMRFLADRYFADDSINALNRWLLSLAAYNAGPARVIQLRAEAAEQGYDPNVWFDNVEIIAARRIGRETTTYVSNVFKYFVSYQMADAQVSENRRRFGEQLAGCERDGA